MSRTIHVTIALVCLLTSSVMSQEVTSQQNGQQELLAERGQRLVEFRVAQESRNKADAIAAVERIAEIERDCIGQAPSEETEETEQLRQDLRGSLAGTLSWLSNVYEEDKQFEKASKTQNELFELERGRLGDDHVQTVDARVRLIGLEAQAKLAPEQRQLLQQANQSHAQAAERINEGETEETLEFEKQVLATQRKLLGDEAPQVQATRYILGILFQRAGDLESSAEHLRAAERVQRRMMGTGHPDWQQTIELLVEVLDILATNAIEHEKFDDALRFQSERLTHLIDRYGAADWHVVDVVHSVADVARVSAMTVDERERLSMAQRLDEEAVELYKEQKHTQAEEEFRKALAIREELLGRDHPQTIVCLRNIAFLQRNRGELYNATTSFRQVNQRRLRSQGSSHPEVRTSLDELSGVLQLLADAALEAENLGLARASHQERLECQVGLFGSKDFHVVDARLALENIDLVAAMTPEQRSQIHKANELNQRAVELYQSGNFSEGLSVARSAAQIRKRVLGEDHPDYAASLNSLAVLYSSMGDYRRAEPLYTQAMEIRKQTLGEEHPVYATSLNNLGLLYLDTGDYSHAEPLFTRAIEISKRVLGEQHPDYATNLNNLASLYRSMGNYPRAEPLYAQAMEIGKQAFGENHPDYATSLNNLASLYRLMGDYPRAEPLYTQAMEIRKQALGEEHPVYATSLNNLAELYRSMGDYPRAELLNTQSMEITKRALGEEHPVYAASLNNLAELYQSMGDYPRAEPLYTQAMETTKRVLGEEHPDYAAYLNNLAELYRSMGDYRRAEQLSSQSMEIRKRVLGEEHPDYATSLNNLAELYHLMGDYRQAEQLQSGAIEIEKRALGEEHAHYATSLNNLAGLYQSMGDYPRAEPLCTQAMEITERVLGEEHPDYAMSLNNLASLSLLMGDYARAEPLFTRAIEIRKRLRSERHPDYATSLNNLAGLYNLMGDYARAVPLFRESVDITLENLEKTSLVLSEQQQQLMNQSVRYKLDNYLNNCLEGKLDAEDAIARLVTWKGSILVRSRGLRLAAEDPAFADQFRQLQSIASQISATTRAIPEPAQMDVWQKRLDSLTEQKRKLEANLMRRSAAFREANKKVTFDQIRQSIPTDGVLVDYLECNGADGRSIVASVIRREGKPILVGLGSAEQASQWIDAWRVSFGMTPDAKAAGLALRQQLWEPLLEHVADANLILVSTDGSLGRMPMAALPGAKPDSYLIEDHRLALIPVPQMLPALVQKREEKSLPRDLLLMGAVDYDAQLDQKNDAPKRRRLFERAPLSDAIRGGVTWNPLPATGDEVRFIAELYQELVDPKDGALIDLRESKASESAFSRYAPECLILHLATHGFFAVPEVKSALSPEAIAERGGDIRSGMFGQQHEMIRGHNPGQLSGIVFAGANHPPPIDPAADSAPDDGIMTADEIAFMPLEGVRLVVLSACETGLGEVAGGEGLLGIQRAFQVSGARSTIASLWKVNDPATKRLMQELYTNYLDKEMTILDALRETQLWALNNPGEVPRGLTTMESTDDARQRLEPKFWAPFVLSGDWR